LVVGLPVRALAIVVGAGLRVARVRGQAPFFERCLSPVTFFKKEGGKTIVDVTTTGLSRNLPALKRISEATGLHVIAGSGYYVLRDADREVLGRKSEEEIADEITADILAGGDEKCFGVNVSKLMLQSRQAFFSE